jgi:KDO2-lipid IV(A) lauroyltransferase
VNLISTGLAVFFIFLVGILPFRILYLLADITRFFLHRVFAYRKKVIRSNLKRCFPEKNEHEIDQLVLKVYKNLADVTVEGFKAFTMTRRQLAERHKIVNPTLLDQFNNSNKNIIATPCHYGNWEWGSLAPSLQLNYQIAAFYTKFSNPYIDKFMRYNRSRTGAKLIPTTETSISFKKMINSRTVFIMAADQSPSKPEKAVWVNFLGQKTAFLDGPERHARANDIPVIFVDIQRVKRGFYELELSFISINSAETTTGEITRAYAGRLEKMIMEKPENWLWSHKRWKLNKQVEDN